MNIKTVLLNLFLKMISEIRWVKNLKLEIKKGDL